MRTLRHLNTQVDKHSYNLCNNFGAQPLSAGFEFRMETTSHFNLRPIKEDVWPSGTFEDKNVNVS